MDTRAMTDQTVLIALLRGAMTQPGIPSQGQGEGTAIVEIHDEAVGRHADLLHERSLNERRSSHSTCE